VRSVRFAVVIAAIGFLFVLNPAGSSDATPGAGGIPLFSVSTIGPAHDITPAPAAFGLTCTSADILGAPPTSGIPCAPRVAPAPPGPVPDGLTASPIDLGLNLVAGPFTDDLDGLSYGEVLSVVATADYDFSVSAAPANGGTTVGAPVAAACAPFVPNVTTQAAALEAQGDIFTTAGVPAGCNTQFTDEAALGLIAPNPAAPGVPPLDNMDALAEYDGMGAFACTFGGGLFVAVQCGAFTVSAGSAVLPAIPPAPGICFGVPADAATILVPPGTPNPGGFNPCMPPAGCPVGGPPCIAVPFFTLGLTGPGLNDIDALCWFDVNANGVPDLPLGLGPFGADMYMFSLAPGSAGGAGGPYSPADIVGYRGATPILLTPPTVIRTPASLGLLATDNVDGLICHQSDVDGDGIPGDLDVCPANADPAQINTDGDTLGDACDPDDDGDGYLDVHETAKGSEPINPNSTPEHCDGVDNDLDTVLDEPAALSGRATPDPLCASGADPDGDTIPNSTDTDDDGDTFLDTNEQFMSTDELDGCSVPPAPPPPPRHDAWPPDADGNGTANVGDLIQLFGGGKILQSTGQPFYSRRSDATANGAVNVGDLIAFFGGGKILSSC
jgi:hypothetical protein